MWQNNGYGSGFPQNNFAQGDFSSSPFAGPGPGQQYFQQNPLQPGQPDLGNGESLLNSAIQPEASSFNETTFLQNQYISPRAQFPPTPLDGFQSLTSTPPRPTQINARAAELKARLLKGRENRASPITPSVTMPGLANQQSNPADKPNSVRGSSKTPVIAIADHEQDRNINELISQYSESNSTVGASLQSEQKDAEPNTLTLHRSSTLPKSSAKPKIPLPANPMKVTAPVTNGSLANISANGGAIKSSNASEISEGEILEDSTPPEALPPTKPKEVQAPAKQVSTDARKPNAPEESKLKSSYDSGSRRERSPSHRLPHIMTSLPSRSRDRHGDSSSRQERKPHTSDHTKDRRDYPDTDKQPHPRRELYEQRDEHHRPSIQGEVGREVITSAREEQLPTLAKLLVHNKDLREWLEITGYHNALYRDKILSRRRAIAELDVQRSKLVAEMEADERSNSRIVPGTQQPGSIILAPPLPTSVGARAGSSVPNTISTVSESKGDLPTSNKRAFSDIQDQYDASGQGKIQRIEDRSPRDEGASFRRPRSSGYDIPRRSSPERGRGRGSSRVRDQSPDFRLYENKFPPARARDYDRDSDDFHDRDDWQDRGRRPFEVRGGYRGRAFDPNYRGRGRGSWGRGEPPAHPDSRVGSPSFGSRIANGKPFKDPRGFERGGKGDTKYFIVKSFNEDNVLKCMQDSIWTTQSQNGPIFSEAFKTYKNVILVFSINKSKAFQGYARMESLPGSVEVPSWQKAISWESAGAFRVKWLVMCTTRFQRVGHLKNALNENQPVLIGKDGQEIEENCGAGLIELMDEEVDEALSYREGAAAWY